MEGLAFSILAVVNGLTLLALACRRPAPRPCPDTWRPAVVALGPAAAQRITDLAQRQATRRRGEL